MRSGPARASMSETARSYRTSARLGLALCLLSLAVIFAGAKGWLPAPMGLAFRPLALAGATLAVWLGAKAHRRGLQDREMESSRAMIVAIAAQLGKQPDETLERIRGKGGPAGEAAGMILQGRREKAARVSRAAAPDAPPGRDARPVAGSGQSTADG